MSNEPVVTSQEFDELSLLGYLRLPQVLKLIPVSEATWWNGCRSGQYPKPYKIAPRTTGWKVKDIVACMESFPLSNK